VGCETTLTQSTLLAHGAPPRAAERCITTSADQLRPVAGSPINTGSQALTLVSDEASCGYDGICEHGPASRAALSARPGEAVVVGARSYVAVMTSPMLCPRTDPELAALDELVFVLHAVTTGMPVLPDGLVPAVRYGLVHPRKEQRVALTPRGVRVLAIARGEVAAGMD
jgi:hypothetical protein